MNAICTVTNIPKKRKDIISPIILPVAPNAFLVLFTEIFLLTIVVCLVEIFRKQNAASSFPCSAA